MSFLFPTGGSAGFNNAADIANIFSRVTGSDISNIDGLLSASGTANLYLINPNGIIFGENARLDLGGSFFASTADSLLFEGDSEFSASSPDAAPLLEVSIPIGLSFRDNPGDVVNRSRAENSEGQVAGLEVQSGNNLAFLGGNLNFEAGNATARGGNIYLGGLAEAGTVDLNEDGSLRFPEDATLANIILTNAADIDTSSTGGGNITVDARNLTLEAGELGSSTIRSAIRSESTNPEAQAGDITIIAESITLDDSRILNQVFFGGAGNSGNITITTNSIEAINGGDISADTFSQGNAGNINIIATGDLSFDGERSNGFAGGITSFVNSNAVGNAGEITISTNNLNLTNGGRVATGTFGQGNAGNIDITATGDLTFDGENLNGFDSGVNSRVNEDAIGDAGDVTISTDNLNLTTGGTVDTSTSGQGNAGNINIAATGDLTFDGVIEDSTSSQIDRDARTISVTSSFFSGLNSRVNKDSVGNAGNITISTNNLVSSAGNVDTSTSSQGNAGNIDITATGDVAFAGNDSSGFNSASVVINSGVNFNGVGDAGDITVSTNNFDLSNGAQIRTLSGGSRECGKYQHCCHRRFNYRWF